MVSELPRDLRLHIAKLVICDMDTRIKLGIIGRLKVPKSLQEKLSSLSLPMELGEDVCGVRIGQHVIFRGITNSKFYANSCVCHEFVKETTGGLRKMLVTRGRDDRVGVYAVSPIMIDYWPYFSAIDML